MGNKVEVPKNLGEPGIAIWVRWKLPTGVRRQRKGLVASSTFVSQVGARDVIMTDLFHFFTDRWSSMGRVRETRL